MLKKMNMRILDEIGEDQSSNTDGGIEPKKGKWISKKKKWKQKTKNKNMTKIQMEWKFKMKKNLEVVPGKRFAYQKKTNTIKVKLKKKYLKQKIHMQWKLKKKNQKK